MSEMPLQDPPVESAEVESRPSDDRQDVTATEAGAAETAVPPDSGRTTEDPEPGVSGNIPGDDPDRAAESACVATGQESETEKKETEKNGSQKKRPPRKKRRNPAKSEQKPEQEPESAPDDPEGESEVPPERERGTEETPDAEFDEEQAPDAPEDLPCGDSEEKADGSGEPSLPRESKAERHRRRRDRRREQREKEREREASLLASAPTMEMEGLVEISPKGFGFLRQRERSYQQAPDDVFITPEIVRIHGLRDGVWVKCLSKQGSRGPQLIELLQINGKEPEAYHNLPYFEELTAINPNKRLALETKPDRLTTRLIDMMTPIGRGQRGLIVSPPRTGKTTFLHHIADGILENYEDEVHLIVMLIDERPEEVTDFVRSFPAADVFASSNDADVKSHTRMAQLAIERAKRLVEAGEHVFILLDSITRLARAFNNSIGGGKNRGTQTGGLAVGALEIPRKLFAAARNTREAGSLTIIATALIQTNSKMDEAIFQEFKGTGNLELVLDRQLAQNYVYPAVDINRSGTRREELLITGHMLEKIHVIRRGIAGYKPIDAMEWLIKAMSRYQSNAQMLMEIRTNAVV